MSSKVQRNCPDCASSPTAATNTPNSATISPLRMLPWLTDATSVRPSTHTASSSGVPIASMNGRRIGIETASRTAPNTPPTIDELNEAPKARPASPRFAIGWPSSTVAADPTAPGTPNRIAGIVSEVAVTAHMPIRKARAVWASMAWVNGISRARPPRPPMPGSMPMTSPSPMPEQMMAKRAGSSTTASALSALSISKGAFRHVLNGGLMSLRGSSSQCIIHNPKCRLYRRRPDAMKIVIPDDYQDMVHLLPSYALIRHHDVVRYRTPARDLDQLLERLEDADVVVAIRERVNFSRAVLSRLPRLRLIALVGRNARTIDFAACTELGIPVATGKSNSPVAPAELAIALMAASRRNIALEAERMRRGRVAVHAVPPSARLDARHFRARRHRQPGRAGRTRPWHERAGVRTGGLAGARRNRRLRSGGRQGRSLRTVGCAVAPCAPQCRHSRHRGRRGPCPHEAHRASRQHCPRRTHRAGRSRRGAESRPSGLCGG